MRALLAELGDPQLAYPSIHVVGTNGKSTTTRMTAALLRAAGLRVGAYTSPHVPRLGTSGSIPTPTDSSARSLARGSRPQRAGATQFEVLTAAALAEFAEQGSTPPSSRPGSAAGSTRRTSSRAPVVVLTNVGLEHTEQLGETREEIAAEKLAVVQAGATVVLAEPEWERARARRPARRGRADGRSNLALAVAAAETFLGRPVDPAAAEAVALPGRLERRGERRSRSGTARTTWTGSAGCSRGSRTGSMSSSRRSSRDKNVDGMLAALSAVGETFVATALGERPRPVRRGTCNACADDGS